MGLVTASDQLRDAATPSHVRRTVLERTALMTAWIAVDVAAMLSLSWRDALSTPVSTATTGAANRLTHRIAQLRTPSADAPYASAVDVYRDARTLAGMMSTRSLRGSPLAAAMTPAQCQIRSGAILDDLGALATTELVIGDTRVGFPWVALSANEIVSRLDRYKLVRPAWARSRLPGDDAKLADHHAALLRSFGDDARGASEARNTFDRAWRIGFEPDAALAIAQNSSAAGPALIHLAITPTARPAVITAVLANAPIDFVQAGALIGGLASGARARSNLLATGQPPIGLRDVETTRTLLDLTLMQTQKELTSCVLALEDGSVRDASMTALLLVTAYAMPITAPGSNARICENDIDCMPPPGGLMQIPPRCTVTMEDAQTPLKMCTGAGWICQRSDDCSLGAECDRSRGRCVPREAYACHIDQPCRSNERCVTRSAGAPRCEVIPPATGRPCERSDAERELLAGEARRGRWQPAGQGSWQCQLRTSEIEGCHAMEGSRQGLVDEVCGAGLASKACLTGGVGACALGAAACREGLVACRPPAPCPEACDGKDNDCDGAIDNLRRVHDELVHDATFRDPSTLGRSYHKLMGPTDCGGIRAFASANSITGDHASCTVVDWADVACRNPDARVSGSGLREICQSYFQAGGNASDAHPNDCRYIIHVAASAPGDVVCQTSHVVSAADHCP
jgi:hypothetical protein